MTRALLALLRFYKAAVSPLLPAACRYTPTCSEYAMTAVEQYGAFRGTLMGIRRVLSCRSEERRVGKEC